MSSAKPILRFWFTVFFGYIEPTSALLGAYYAHFQKHEYLSMTHPFSTARQMSVAGSIVLTQLANLYLFFAINESLVLRSTSDTRVWKAVLFGLLVADIGHLYSVAELGETIYYDTDRWNPIHLGNVPFVYLGAVTRILYLAFPIEITLV